MPLRHHPREALSQPRTSLLVGLAVLLVVASRAPFLDAPLSRDEAGFLVLGREWHHGLGSLYGRYWVDRPPLLILLFRIGDLLGGAVGLRVLGTLAAVLVVVLVGVTARRLGGARAQVAATFAAAVMLATPYNGTSVVDGELLAVPFVALGLWAWCAAPTRSSGALARGAIAGAAAVGAVLVKQNFIDVFLFVAVVEALRGFRLSRTRLLSWCGFGIGALASAAGILGYAVAHGTSLAELYDAMFPFRLAARSLASDSPGTPERVTEMARFVVIGGLLPLTLYAAWRLRRAWSTPHRAVVVGLLAVLGFDVVAIVLGGGYWSHYLVQPIVPVALLVGVGAVMAKGEGEPWDVRAPRLLTALLVGLAIVTVAATVARVDRPVHAPGGGVGALVADAARPGDTIMALYGDPSIVEASGLTSPYPYLWSLPIRVRDPERAEVDRILSGPEAPTWVVVTRSVEVRGNRVDVAHIRQVLDERYLLLRTACGMRIYLRADQERLLDGTPRCSVRLRSPSS